MDTLMGTQVQEGYYKTTGYTPIYNFANELPLDATL
jgi:hypothetical protein